MSSHAQSPQMAAPQPLPGVENVVAIGSGKGGVGKTTVAVNLAVALAKLGHRVGLLDADIYGPNVPLMLGTEETPKVQEDKRRNPQNFLAEAVSSRLGDATMVNVVPITAPDFRSKGIVKAKPRQSYGRR